MTVLEQPPVAKNDMTVADSLFNQLRQLADPANESLPGVAAQARGTALFARLMSVNRAAGAVLRAHKQSCISARTELEHTQLGLQNLSYEKRHLEREIEKCRQFASIFQDVPLHAIEEFFDLAPEELRKDDVKENEHQLMLNRLSFELSERQRLELKRKELTQQKEELLKQSKIKTTIEDNVKNQIESLVKTATDIQKKVDDMVQPIPRPSST